MNNANQDAGRGTFQPVVPPLDELACGDWENPSPPWLCPLFGFRLVRVSGTDASEFLNNQLTNDLQGMDAAESRLAGYCNPKGRLYAVFRVFLRSEGDYLLRLETGVADAVVKRLRMFVLRADVEIREEETLGGVGLIGGGTGVLLRNTKLPAPERPFGVANHGDCSVIRSPGLCERYEIYAPHDTLAALWEPFVRNAAAPAPDDVWRLYDVLSGLPDVHPQTTERFVPQMVNLDLVGGVSFSKGCYPGQEVIARMHYLGKVKRRMYRFVLNDAEREASPGDPVFVAAYSETQPSGEVVEACLLPNGTLHGLASLRTKGLEDTVRLGAPDGATAQLQPLPYEVTEDIRGDS